jgi:hypothetical protein
VKTSYTKQLALAVMALAVAIGQGCVSEDDKDSERKPDLSDIPGHDGMGIDSRRTQGPRTMTAETYLQSYMALFGASSPSEVATLAKGADGREIFETWSDHIGALGLPDYATDIARAGDTNALMLGAYERLGMALCERAAERDLRATGGSTARIVFDFSLPSNSLDRAAFDAGFDVLHRTTLGYPARLAPRSRSEGFFKLYSTVVGSHGQAGAVTSRLSPAEAGWAAVCEGLLRHPEFHLY